MDFIAAKKAEAQIKRIVKAAADPRVVAFPLGLRKPWRRLSQPKLMPSPRPAA